MKRYFARIVTLLLVSGIAADPATATGFSHFCPVPEARAITEARQDIWSDQALMLELTNIAQHVPLWQSKSNPTSRQWHQTGILVLTLMVTSAWSQRITQTPISLEERGRPEARKYIETLIDGNLEDQRSALRGFEDGIKRHGANLWSSDLEISAIRYVAKEGADPELQQQAKNYLLYLKRDRSVIDLIVTELSALRSQIPRYLWSSDPEALAQLERRRDRLEKLLQEMNSKVWENWRKGGGSELRQAIITYRWQRTLLINVAKGLATLAAVFIAWLAFRRWPFRRSSAVTGILIVAGVAWWSLFGPLTTSVSADSVGIAPALIAPAVRHGIAGGDSFSGVGYLLVSLGIVLCLSGWSLASKAWRQAHWNLLDPRLPSRRFVRAGMMLMGVTMGYLGLPIGLFGLVGFLGTPLMPAVGQFALTIGGLINLIALRRPVAHPPQLAGVISNERRPLVALRWLRSFLVTFILLGLAQVWVDLWHMLSSHVGIVNVFAKHAVLLPFSVPPLLRTQRRNTSALTAA